MFYLAGLKKAKTPIISEIKASSSKKADFHQAPYLLTYLFTNSAPFERSTVVAV